MRAALGLAAIVLLAVSLGACGGGASSVHSSSSASRTHHRDRDDDFDNNDDDAHVLDYGHAATGAERRALVTLVSSYYAASAQADGAKACGLLMPFLAEGVAEELGHRPGLEGHDCATVMSKLFRQHRKLLEGESATLKFVAIRVGEGHALDVLSFAVLPEVRQITARRDGSSWKILNLLDRILE
jgi:hypothetical protein